MSIDFLKRLLLFFGLLLAQVLVLNHVHLFGVAIPLLYVYFVLSFPRDYPRNGALVWSFLLGLFIDIFSNTPGVAAFSMTLVAVLQPYVLRLFIQRDNDDNIQPSIFALGINKYTLYALILIFVYCLTFFTMETFTFFNFGKWFLSVVGSTTLTLFMVVVIDNLRKD